MLKYYKLDGKMAVQCSSLLEWGEWMQYANTRVLYDEIFEIHVSTVFLGLNHNFCGKGDPILFETMVFLPNGKPRNMRRYFTWGEAEQGHKEIADLVRAEAMEADYDAIEVVSKLMLKMSYGK